MIASVGAFDLRDLHVFFIVAQRGSMAKAAVELRITQPAVSRVIADLEHALRVRLLDRSPQGVEPTIYGRALLKRGLVVFDELKQAIRDIDFLTNPYVGEIRVCGVDNLLIAPAVSPGHLSLTACALQIRIEHQNDESIFAGSFLGQVSGPGAPPDTRAYRRGAVPPGDPRSRDQSANETRRLRT